MKHFIDKSALIEQLLKAHETYYDVQRNYEFGGRTWPGYAEFHTHGEKYVLAKRAKLWEVDAHEYLFFTTLEEATKAAVGELVQFMTTEALNKVQAAPDHMTSYLSLVIVADRATDEAIHAIKHTHWRKNFLFGIHGWADLRLALINLETNEVYTNGQGKKLQPTLEANLVAHSAKRGDD